MPSPALLVGRLANGLGMAITIKSTYSLDVESVRSLELLARRWDVSKSEALRRMIREARDRQTPGVSDAAEALDILQCLLKLTPRKADQWRKHVRTEPRAFPQ
jgi:hypothetical protein